MARPAPMTAARFRRMALGLDGVVEASHMNHPDFRVGGKIFASLHEDLRSGMVKLSPEDQARFIDDAPKAFSPEAGAWGRAGCTRVSLVQPVPSSALRRSRCGTSRS